MAPNIAGEKQQNNNNINTIYNNNPACNRTRNLSRKKRSIYHLATMTGDIE